MSDYTKYTKQEMQAYAIAKSIKENQIVIVGTGLPLIGASLAKRAICPSCHPIVESGLMDQLGSLSDAFSWLHRQIAREKKKK